MRVGPDLERCARCGGVFPRTSEFFFFARSGPKAGAITGYHKTCHAAWHRAYWAERATADQKHAHRLRIRAWHRRVHRTDPADYLPQRYAENRP